MWDRLKKWLKFNKEMVKQHLPEYCDKQYSDDDLEDWSVQRCMDSIKGYVSRFGKGARGPEEERRDMLKIAHFASIIWNKTNPTNGK